MTCVVGVDIGACTMRRWSKTVDRVFTTVDREVLAARIGVRYVSRHVRYNTELTQ